MAKSTRATIHSAGSTNLFYPFSNCSLSGDVSAQELNHAIDNDLVELLYKVVGTPTHYSYGFTPKGRTFLRQLKNRFGV